jgi:crotonobetainyl-CoA:carnitine CoA-transferase CaiB-like acyl-CoA transferase
MKLGEVAGAEREQYGKPLAGLRVLAPEQVQAMPYATQLMAMLGAEVVKVEHPITGESGRQAQPSLIDDDGRSVGATYLRNNLSKKSLGLDLKREQGRAIFRRLVPHFDVVAENFKPGTMKEWGLGYDELSKINPRLIYVSVSGFGNLEPSPYRSWPAYAPIVEAMAGIFDVLRKPGQYPPHNLGGAIGDIAASLFAVIGVLSAVIQRERTGVGQAVDVSMYDSMLAMADMVPFMWSMGVPHPAQRSSGLVGAFKAKDGFFILAVLREHQFRRLTEVLGTPEWLADPRLSSRQGWVEQLDSIVRPAVEAWATDKTKLEASSMLCDAGLAAGPYNSAEDLAVDPHLQQHHMLIEVPKPGVGKPMLVVGNPIKMSGVADGPVHRWPRLGEHTGDLLSELLDLADEEIAALRSQGIVGGAAAEATR